VLHSSLLAWTLFLSSFSILYKYPLPISTHYIEEKEESSICSIANILYYSSLFSSIYSAGRRNIKTHRGPLVNSARYRRTSPTSRPFIVEATWLSSVSGFYIYQHRLPLFFFLLLLLYKIVQMCLPVFFPSSILHRDLLLLSLWMLLLTRVAFHFGSVPATVSMKIFANFIFLFFSFCCVLCVSHSVKWIALSLSFQKLYRHGHIIPSIEQHSSSIAPSVIYAYTLFVRDSLCILGARYL
jgi:hypothetical protein